MTWRSEAVSALALTASAYLLQVHKPCRRKQSFVQGSGQKRESS
jgi:hypothetical protein